MNWLGEVEWAAWAQAAAALVALSFGPTALQSIWNRLYYSFAAVSRPQDIKAFNGAERWTISIRNRSSRMRSLETLIYPRRPGNLIAYASIQPENDGGLMIDKAALDGGALRVQVSRFGPKRVIEISIIFVGADIPLFDQKSGTLKDKLDLLTHRGSPERSGIVLVGHSRITALMMNFVAATVIIVGRMIYVQLIQ